MADRCPLCGREFDITIRRTSCDGQEVCVICKKEIDAAEDKAAAIENIKNRRLELQSAAANILDFDLMDPETAAKAKKDFNEAKKSFLCTTGNKFEGYKITDYIGITSGQSALGCGFLTGLSFALSDFTGAENTVINDKLQKAKEIALDRLIFSCLKLGANAVLGVDIEIMNLSSSGIIIVSANGTAVKIE